MRFGLGSKRDSEQNTIVPQSEVVSVLHILSLRLRDAAIEKAGSAVAVELTS